MRENPFFRKTAMNQEPFIPHLQRMTDYITNHYEDELLQELESCLHSSTLPDLNIDPSLDLAMEDGEPFALFFDHSGSKLRQITFWQMSRTHLAADLQVRLRIGVSRDGELPRFFQRRVYFSADFDLTGGIQRLGGITGIAMEPPLPRDGIRLSDRLVPLLRYDDMDTLFRDMHLRYLGKDAEKILRLEGAKALANAMGLTILPLSLHGNKGTRAMLFAQEANVLVNTSNGAEEDYREMHVPPRTVVLNLNASRQDAAGEQLAIYHECAHWEYHSMFLMLQQLHKADLQLLKFDHADKASLADRRDVLWVERQANYFAYAAILPKERLAPLMRRYWNETKPEDNVGDRVEKVIRRIGRDLQLPKSIIRTRMVMLGSVAAKGACNYVDGGYIRPFAFDPVKLKGGETFVIDRQSFAHLFAEDADFRALMRSQNFLYVEGHVCMDHPQCAVLEKKGYILTEWARSHVDECCLKFRREYLLSPASQQIGVLHSVQKFNESYAPVIPQGRTQMTQEQMMARDADYLAHLPRTPAQALTQIIKDFCGTQREAAFSCGLSEPMISRMCNENTFRYSIQQVTRLAVGLHMPPPLSALFLEMAGFTHMMMINYYRYECIIVYMWHEDIEKVQEVFGELL